VLSANPTKNLKLSIAGLNLLDEEYFYPEQVRKNLETIPGGPGRGVYVSVGYDL
jgi:outer membrane receptor protein involved in Fe transport